MGLAAVLGYRPFLVHYHRALVRDGRGRTPDEPTNWKGYFSPGYLRWRAQGRPDIGERMKRAEKHEDALVRLGHLERRVYRPKHFTAHVVTKIRKRVDKGAFLFFRHVGDGRVEVVARKEDFAAIENVLENVTERMAAGFE